MTFVFHNTGALVHDALLGPERAQAQHERETREATGGMDTMHDDLASGTTVRPGQTATLTHTFTEAGTIGCHQPGHYQAGMRLALTVR